TLQFYGTDQCFIKYYSINQKIRAFNVRTNTENTSFFTQIIHLQVNHHKSKTSLDGITMLSWTRLSNPLKMGFQFVNVFSTSSQTPTNAKFWSKLFGKYLLLTNTVGSGLLVAIGDAVAQQYEGIGEKKTFDYSRSGCMMITGLVIGPVQHSFYLLLDRLLSDTGRWGVLHKILADQLIMSPTYIFLFFYVSSLLAGRTIAECNGELAEKFLYTWLLDCCYWPVLQYLNFRFFKSNYRVIFVNVANCVYVILLSYIKYGFSSQDP
ncbi:uncharacterized protein Dyak_GE20673, partial [Drosophila yakuba]